MCQELLGPLSTYCTLSSKGVPLPPGFYCQGGFSTSNHNTPNMNTDCNDFINDCLSNPCKCVDTYLDQRTYSWLFNIGPFCYYNCQTQYMVAIHECVLCDPAPEGCSPPPPPPPPPSPPPPPPDENCLNGGGF